MIGGDYHRRLQIGQHVPLLEIGPDDGRIGREQDPVFKGFKDQLLSD
jgi:hypothetical protein